jgi:hypothetical protein
MTSARWVGLALAGGCLLVLRACVPHGNPAPIVWSWGSSLVPRFVGRPAVPHPIVAPPVPQHPFMAANGANNMHNDSYITDTHAVSGPLGMDPEVRSTARGLLGGECASVTFDRQGRIVTVCMSARKSELLLLDPRTLAELASWALPLRPSAGLDVRKIVNDTSGGAYFYLDEGDRAVIADAARHIQVIAHHDGPGGPVFERQRDWDLGPAVASPDRVTTTLPDWEGRLWFVTRLGVVGTLDPASGRIATRPLPGEEIQNSLAVGRDGVFIVSDHALYGFRADSTGAPAVVWREPYDRGTRRKVGMINQGSGTTPTLLGEDLVAIADNAEPRIDVLVYRRGADVAGERLVCKQPMFPPDRSAVENTLVGVGRSLVVENNHGYDIFATMMFGRTASGGVARIDLDDGGGCHVAWESAEMSMTTVPKLSLGNGLLYLYTKMPDAPWWTDAYYLTTVDFRTGETVYRVLTGTGLGYDNNWAPITLGPDGTAYVGTLRGLVAVRDGAD